MRGVRWTSFSIPAPGLGHGEVLQKAAQLHDEGHLAGGKILPNEHRATRAMDTSTSALMSKAVTRPMMASSRIGTPQRRMATQAGSTGRFSPQKMLHRRDTPPRTRKVMSFLVPPHAKNASKRSIVSSFSL